MKLRLMILGSVLYLFVGLVSCDEAPLPVTPPDPSETPEEKISQTTKRINIFIQDVMTDVYLWYNEVPDINPNSQSDPKEYFDKLLYTEDRWSFVTDDAEALEQSFEGIEESYGWSLAFGEFYNSKDLFAVVEYVYPNTPAEEAGIVRGDIIIEIDSGPIGYGNYTDLLNSLSLNITMGVDTDQGIALGGTKDLIARKLELDPVMIKKVIDYEGRKVGYLFYAQYIAGYNNSLDSAFQYFKEQGVSDVILDLRYNPGGGTVAAEYLCSSLAPVSVVDAKSTLVSFQWNDKYQDYWERQNSSGDLGIYFNDNVKYKMGLDKIHILTGRGTASASELTITGLDAYMDVITIGESTYGKYTASITLKPEDLYRNYPATYTKSFDNWAVQPIVLRYANANGVTDFKDGFQPDILVEEDLIGALPLGDPSEELLKVALDDIAGISTVAMKSRSKRAYKIIDRGFSIFDANKRELRIDNKDFIINKE